MSDAIYLSKEDDQLDAMQSISSVQFKAEVGAHS